MRLQVKHFGFLIFFFLIGFSSAQDSTRVKIFGIKPNFLQLSPLKLTGDSLHLQFDQQRYPKLSSQFYNLNRVMPPNKFLWDYRESSYYTPLWVKNKMARIMNRPAPGEVWPILPVALIAARLALQQIEINKKIVIKPQDYLVAKKYWPILKALWEKSPQTAAQLYRRIDIKNSRTLTNLEQDLQYLVDQKLLKSRTLPGQETEYFASQSRGQAILLLKKALQDDHFSMQQKKKFLDLKNYITREAD